MRLHWKVATGSLLELAVTATGAAATGWFSVAFSKSGGMVTSDAVIANQGGSPVPVNTYAVTSYSTVKATTAFGAGSRSFTGGTTATMKFTRSTGDGGAAPVNVKGSNRMVYAYSKSGAKTIAYHGSHYQPPASPYWRGRFQPAPSAHHQRPPASPFPLRHWKSLPRIHPPRIRLPSRPAPAQVSDTCCPSVALVLMRPVLPPHALTAAFPPPLTSTLPGYAFQVALRPPNLFLHWTPVSATQVDMAIEAKAAGRAKDGWIALGWSPKGKMSPADAVIGNLAGGLVMPYVIKGYSMSKIQPAAFSIGSNAATVTTATNDTIITFSRTKNSGVVMRFPMAGLSKLVWAFSRAGFPSLSFHGNS
ncbi:unnamed protein product, partial [Closterium sp. Naga37s-1]